MPYLIEKCVVLQTKKRVKALYALFAGQKGRRPVARKTLLFEIKGESTKLFQQIKEQVAKF